MDFENASDKFNVFVKVGGKLHRIEYVEFNKGDPKNPHYVLSVDPLERGDMFYLDRKYTDKVNKKTWESIQ